MNKILYKNILNGKYVLETDDSYAKRILKPNFFEEHFLSSLDLEILDELVFSNCNIYKLMSKDKKTLTIFYQSLKNSGSEGNDNKRFQVPNSLSEFYGENFWFVGSYNCGDKVLFVITKDDYYLTKDRNVKSYSSLWIEFIKLEEAYLKNISIFTNRNERKYYIIDSNNILNHSFQSYYINVILNDSVKNIIALSDSDIQDTEYELYDESKHSKINKESLAVLKNTDFRTMALEKAGYRCELCGTQETFIDSNGKMYFEGHHIIPYNINSQQKYKFLLDNPTNISCLCPNCHKRIHFSNIEVKKTLILALLNRRLDLLKKFEIKNIDDIINLYSYE